MEANHYPAMTVEEFLAWENQQEDRHEFDGVRAIDKPSGTAAHSLICGALIMAVHPRLRGTACRFATSILKIGVNGKIRYTDGFVYCKPVLPTATVVYDPVVIFEVTSAESAMDDYGVKNRDYSATPSVRRYVILEQDQVGGTMFERISGDWVGHILRADAMLRMPEIGIEVPLAEFYIDLPMETPPNP